MNLDSCHSPDMLVVVLNVYLEIFEIEDIGLIASSKITFKSTAHKNSTKSIGFVNHVACCITVSLITWRAYGSLPSHSSPMTYSPSFIKPILDAVILRLLLGIISHSIWKDNKHRRFVAKIRCLSGLKIKKQHKNKTKQTNKQTKNNKQTNKNQPKWIKKSLPTMD